MCHFCHVITIGNRFTGFIYVPTQSVWSVIFCVSEKKKSYDRLKLWYFHEKMKITVFT